MEFLIVIVVALSFTIGTCTSTDLCSSKYDVGLNAEGAIQFPVFHTKHPCAHALRRLSNTPDTISRVFGHDDIHKDEFFMGIYLGTPAVFNLVTIDTGSALSWVQCWPCEINCHDQALEAGPIFDPRNSTTYRHIGCSTEECNSMQNSFGIPYGCIEEEDTCLYNSQYASGGPYSVGKFIKDKLTLADGYSIDDFIFGCSQADKFNGHEAGIIGFANQSYSFFKQVASQINYRAFSYCFPSNDRNVGFLSIGRYDRLKLSFTALRPYGHKGLYSIRPLSLMVNGKPLAVDQYALPRELMVVASGTPDTYIPSSVFSALQEALAAAIQVYGYIPQGHSNKICFTSPSHVVNWSDLPTVKMTFTRFALKLPPENVFYYNPRIGLCSTFLPVDSGVRGVLILGNRALRSFRVAYDFETNEFGFQPGAC